MKFKKNEILALAALAKLNLDANEIKLYQQQLAEVLSYVDKIKKIELNKQISHLEQADLVLRPDKEKPGEPLIFLAASQISNGYLVAPNVFKK